MLHLSQKLDFLIHIITQFIFQVVNFKKSVYLRNFDFFRKYHMKRMIDAIKLNGTNYPRPVLSLLYIRN